MTPDQIEFDAVISNDVRIHLPEQNTEIALQSLRIRAQNIYAPPELILSLQPEPAELARMKIAPQFVSKGWVHYQMKPELLAAHPALFEMEDQDLYFQTHLDFLGDLSHYEILPAGALA